MSGFFAAADSVDTDDAWPVQRAGELAFAAGEGARAQQAWRLAFELWRCLKREDRILSCSAFSA